MNFYKKEVAPVTEEAWEAINEEAAQTIRNTLIGRKFIRVSQPKGLAYDAVGLGTLSEAKSGNGDIKYGIRQVMPLVETRIPFELNIWELDNINRGAETINLDPITKAAREAARFEDNAVLNGLKEAGIEGITEQKEYDSIALQNAPGSIMEGLSEAILQMREASQQGPFHLVVTRDMWRIIASSMDGYPLKERIKKITEGSIFYSPDVAKPFLVSAGGDLQLTLGQDFSIGYEAHTTQTVRLFISESFTFQIKDPNNVLVFS